MDGESKLWHRRFNHSGLENLEQVVRMVDGMPSTVALAKREPGTACVPRVYGKMARSPHRRSTTTTTKCELVQTDVDGPSTASLGGSVYFVTLMEGSSGFITATPIKSKGMVPDVRKARIKQLETLTGPKMKWVRHDRAKEYLSRTSKLGMRTKALHPRRRRRNRLGRTKMLSAPTGTSWRAFARLFWQPERKRSCGLRLCHRSYTCSTDPPRRVKT